jgi:hypothetical protein
VIAIEPNPAREKHSVFEQVRGSNRSVRQYLCLVAVAAVLLFGLAAQALPAAAQDDGIAYTFYGYFSPDVETAITLGQMTADDPSLAAELVSPRNADDFFEGFTLLTDYDFADNLDAGYIDAVDDADEYMVFAGDLDYIDGVEPGYVIFLSTAQQVFVLFAYEDDADDLFGLAAEAIDEGDAPEEYSDFTRFDLSDDAVSEGDVDEPADRDEDEDEPDTRSGNDDDEDEPVDRDEPADRDETELCQEDPAFEALDLDGDGLVSIEELEAIAAEVPELEELYEEIEAAGISGIRYENC